MNARSVSYSRILFTAAVLAMAVVVVERPTGQEGPVLTVLSREARRTIPISTSGSQEMIGLDDLSSIFQLTVREEAGALTLSYKGRTIVLTPDQTIASVAGRVISLPAPPARRGNRWLVPVEIVSRALAPVYDARLDLRRASRLLIVGDLRVPRLAVVHEGVGGNARVTIESTPRAGGVVMQESNQRLTVRFDADVLDVAFPSSQISGFVQGYRSIDATTIAIELGPRFSSFRASAHTTDSSSRLVIDLLGPQTDTPPPLTTTQTEPVAPAELPALSVATGHTIAIDAGHGGEDAGAKGGRGTAEKDITLALARHLKTAIEGRLGFRVVMTREDDRAVAVTDRAALANNNKADLFISLHANASPRSSATGATFYVASFDEGAGITPETSPVRLPAIGGGIRDIELVPWNLAQIRYKDQSEAFAGLISDALRARVPLAAKPVERAPLRVLEPANMPAVFVEAGYLSNPDQETLLASADFQAVLAQGIVDAIVRFRNVASLSEGSAR